MLKLIKGVEFCMCLGMGWRSWLIVWYLLCTWLTFQSHSSWYLFIRRVASCICPEKAVGSSAKVIWVVQAGDKIIPRRRPGLHWYLMFPFHKKCSTFGVDAATGLECTQWEASVLTVCWRWPFLRRTADLFSDKWLSSLHCFNGGSNSTAIYFPDTVWCWSTTCDLD